MGIHSSDTFRPKQHFSHMAWGSVTKEVQPVWYPRNIVGISSAFQDIRYSPIYVCTAARELFISDYLIDLRFCRRRFLHEIKSSAQLTKRLGISTQNYSSRCYPCPRMRLGQHFTPLDRSSIPAAWSRSVTAGQGRAGQGRWIPDLCDLARVARREPFHLHDLGQLDFYLGCTSRTCTLSHMAG